MRDSTQMGTFWKKKNSLLSQSYREMHNNVWPLLLLLHIYNSFIIIDMEN